MCFGGGMIWLIIPTLILARVIYCIYWWHTVKVNYIGKDSNNYKYFSIKNKKYQFNYSIKYNKSNVMNDEGDMLHRFWSKTSRKINSAYLNLDKMREKQNRLKYFSPPKTDSINGKIHDD